MRIKVIFICLHHLYLIFFFLLLVNYLQPSKTVLSLVQLQGREQRIVVELAILVLKPYIVLYGLVLYRTTLRVLIYQHRLSSLKIPSFLMKLWKDRFLKVLALLVEDQRPQYIHCDLLNPLP
jgi:hypothetical protein